MNNQSKGQALVTLLFYMLIAITVTTLAVSIVLSNSQAANALSQGQINYYIAESGAENALIRLLRNPAYTGESLAVDGGTAVITVSGNNPYIINSTGTLGQFVRKIEVTVSYNNNIMTVNSWKEIF